MNGDHKKVNLHLSKSTQLFDVYCCSAWYPNCVVFSVQSFLSANSYQEVVIDDLRFWRTMTRVNPVSGALNATTAKLKMCKSAQMQDSWNLLSACQNPGSQTAELSWHSTRQTLSSRTISRTQTVMVPPYWRRIRWGNSGRTAQSVLTRLHSTTVDHLTITSIDLNLVVLELEICSGWNERPRPEEL